MIAISARRWGSSKCLPRPDYANVFDQDATDFSPLIESASIEFIQQTKAPVSALRTGHIPLDMDVFPMDNSGTKKEGVSRTYKQHDGYAPIAAYLGLEGWNIGIELREGSWHCQKEFSYVLDRVLPRAKSLANGSPILCRLDSGHDAKENRARSDRRGHRLSDQMESTQAINC